MEKGIINTNSHISFKQSLQKTAENCDRFSNFIGEVCD